MDDHQVCPFCAAIRICIEPEGNHYRGFCSICKQEFIIRDERVPDQDTSTSDYLIGRTEGAKVIFDVGIKEIRPYVPRHKETEEEKLARSQDQEEILAKLEAAGHDRNEYEQAFLDYIEKTSKIRMQFIGEFFDQTAPYKHRWEASYRRGIMTKFNNLEIFLKRRKLTCGMLSLTTAQAGKTDIEILNDLKEAWKKLSETMSKMGFQYFRLFEPHESGAPHMHALIAGDCSKARIDRLQNLWHKKYGMGAEGIDFKFSQGLRDNPDIVHLTNYLMKYLSKTLISDFNKDPNLVRFHALFWHTNSRMFSSSRFFAWVMRKQRNVKVPIEAIKMNGDRYIYDKATSVSKPCKYQQIKGIRFRYDLLPFEQREKLTRNLDFKPYSHNEQRDRKTGQRRFPAMKSCWYRCRNFIEQREILLQQYNLEKEYL